LITAIHTDHAHTDAYTLDDIMKLSKNPEAYKSYYKHFLKCVIPPTTFKRCLTQSPTSLGSQVDRDATSKKNARERGLVEFVTEAEETLGLFVLENFSDVWQEQLEQEVAGTTEEKNKTYPKYTKAKKDALILQQTEGNVHVANGKKLSDAGTVRWNELSMQVKSDRERPERKAWEKALLEEMAAELLGGRKRPRETATRVAPSTVKLFVSIPGWVSGNDQN
jgi:hypothetical protein